MVARSQVLSSVIMGFSIEKEELGLTSRERVSLTLTTKKLGSKTLEKQRTRVISKKETIGKLIPRVPQ